MDESLRDHMNLPALQQLVDLLELVNDEGAAATQARSASPYAAALPAGKPELLALSSVDITCPPTTDCAATVRA
jgi:hypothetical protein